MPRAVALIASYCGDYLEMTIDNSYGIGDRTIEAGAEVSYRGT